MRISVNAARFLPKIAAVVFELGRFYNKYLDNIADIFYNAVMQNDQTWASKVQARKKLMNIYLKTLTAALEEAEYSLIP